MMRHQKIYLDYAATTPVDPAVFRVMKPYFSEKFGNAGSLHSFGQEAIAALDRSREIIAGSINADFRGIIFTSSATEANNLAIYGIVKGFFATHHGSIKPRIIISSIEHESVLETVRDLENNNVDVVYLSVNKAGVVDLKELETSLNENTILVSVMYANNEVGTIQPIQKITEVIETFKKEHFRKETYCPLFHTDASQAFQFLNCDAAELGVDFMTLSSHKIYGPKGAGALYIKQAADGKQQTISLSPILTGGGQEFGLRSGTENIPAIVGFAKATELSAHSRKLANKKIAGLRDELWRGIKKMYPKAEINGAPFSRPITADNIPCLPNILNVYFPGHDAQDLLTKFDLLGLSVSSGSACRARATLSSYVIEALGHPQERAESSIRFSLGRPTTKEEIMRAVQILKRITKPGK
jgi:cysteine desulfurase